MKYHENEEIKIKGNLKDLKQQNQRMISNYNQKVIECNSLNGKLEKANQKLK